MRFLPVYRLQRKKKKKEKKGFAAGNDVSCSFAVRVCAPDTARAAAAACGPCGSAVSLVARCRCRFLMAHTAR